ncbi:MAG: T9SS type A sorting domain-containing protein [Bacteroidetes bacterium]|nr:T9SS type A sorting domain-containing protein [Bacteroidota bacterium]MBT4408575.1 T9SS type A sorting domain-containing protein [Bacteroidota bacterium]MBT5425277.1 T9SS type A sorting domain-containing protein [Bacteroidota bacterium]MBT7462857.1 T9SS type A sorting domain-containing protein [Bacteroidota bacterium]
MKMNKSIIIFLLLGFIFVEVVASHNLLLNGTKISIVLPENDEVDFSKTEFTTADIRINEVVARNAKGLQDEAGDDDDWIELYNPGGSDINIAGLYMSDTSLPTSFHRIPGSDASKTTIPAGGHLILWADGESGEGINHLPFKLSNGGETVYLAQLIGGQVNIIDQISYPKLERDVPYGRYPDGSNNWQLLSDPSPNSQNLPVRSIGNVLMNEIMAVNRGVDTDEYGESEDWIEFFNPSGNPIDVGGAYLTDSIGELTMHRIPIYFPDSTTVPAGGFLRLWADGDPKQGILHIDFRLSGNGEKVTMVQADGLTIMTQAQYPAASSDATFGRFPDGSDNWIFLNIPSPEAENQYTYTQIDGVVINEIMASNESYLPDNFGEIEDWIEFYNTNDFAVDIGGLIVTDSLLKPINYRIPATAPDSTTIPAHGFLVFWADNDPEQGVRHLDIKLSGSGESVGLVQYRSTSVFLDSHTFTTQEPNVSIGRFPDGTGSWLPMKVPTPGYANSAEINDRVTGIFINEILARNTKIFPDENGEFSDWIELYNINNQAVNLAGLFLTDDTGDPGLFQIPSTDPQKTTIPAKGYLVFRPDASPENGILHTNFLLAGAGEQVGLFELVDGTYHSVDEIAYGQQSSDISYGRLFDGATDWGFFETPTPGVSNVVEDDLITGLYINELMARNVSTISDEAGNFVDWIEIYNNSNVAIDLGGLYLTDDMNDPLASLIPTTEPGKTTVPAKGYLLLWPDNNLSLGPTHVDFQLAGAGEHIGLVQRIGGENHVLDDVSYPVQTTDVSYARSQDGASDWSYMTTPTPLSSNSGSGIENEFEAGPKLLLYPNPVGEELFLNLEGANTGMIEWKIVDIQGRDMAKGAFFLSQAGQKQTIGSTSELNLKDNGMYFIFVNTGEERIVKSFMLMRK